MPIRKILMVAEMRELYQKKYGVSRNPQFFQHLAKKMPGAFKVIEGQRGVWLIAIEDALHFIETHPPHQRRKKNSVR